ncbi:MAG: hypothetical protein IJM63_04700 [Solobacterium sp.]|nr:hypothetical protein [Solobacterium sp.]
MAYNKHLQKLILDVVDNQMRDNTPPQVSVTFKALRKLGYSEHEAKLAIGQAVVTELFDVMKNNQPYDEDRYVEALKQIAEGNLLYTGEDMDSEDYSFDEDPYDWDDPYEDEENEEFMDPDEPCEFLWQDLYRDYDIDDLHDFAVAYGLKTKNKSEEELAKAIAEKLLDPRIMRDNFVRMNDEMADKVDMLMDEGILIVEEELMDLLQASMVNPLYFHAGMENEFIACREVQKAYREMNTPEFRAMRREWNWTFQCLVVFMMHYGIGPVSAFADLYNTHPQLSIEENDVIGRLKSMGPEIGKEYFQVNNLIASRSLQKKKEWKKLQAVQGDQPFRRFTYGEIKDLGAYQYPYSHPDWAAVRDFLNEAEEMTYTTEDCLRMLVRMINAKQEPDQYFAMLDDMYISLNEEEADRFAQLCPKLLKSTPLLEKRGNCDPDAAVDVSAWNEAAEKYKEEVRERRENRLDYEDFDPDELPF